MVVVATAASVPSLKKKKLQVRVYPANSFNDSAKENVLAFSDVDILDPDHLPIPLTDKQSWALCVKIHKKKTVVRLADLKEFQVTRGEINQTIYREFIRAKSQGHQSLLKGAIRLLRMATSENAVFIEGLGN